MKKNMFIIIALCAISTGAFAQQSLSIKPETNGASGVILEKTGLKIDEVANYTPSSCICDEETKSEIDAILALDKANISSIARDMDLVEKCLTWIKENAPTGDAHCSGLLNGITHDGKWYDAKWPAVITRWNAMANRQWHCDLSGLRKAHEDSLEERDLCGSKPLFLLASLEHVRTWCNVVVPEWWPNNVWHIFK
ncbi:hypothetical protein FACS1894162_7750 [Bacteroidia bacterium]|nr:hypothetical protein FACS1894162_7750 [Bacteroidia bacterium]